MAFLNFIQEHKAAQQPSTAEKSQETRPQTDRQKYHEQQAREAAGAPKADQISEAHKSQAKELGQALDKSMRQSQGNAPAHTAAPSDGAGSREAMRQNMSSQDKAAPDLSPTSMQSGKSASEKEVASPSTGGAAKQQEQSPVAPSHTPTAPPRGRSGPSPSR